MRRTDAFELWSWRRLLRVPWNARRSNQSILKEINPENWKDWCWRWNSNTLAMWCEEPIHWKRPWCWERLKTGGDGDDRGWDGWMASPTQWTWVWVGSRSWWRTGKPCMLKSMELRRVRHNWVSELWWKVANKQCTKPYSKFSTNIYQVKQKGKINNWYKSEIIKGHKQTKIQVLFFTNLYWKTLQGGGESSTELGWRQAGRGDRIHKDLIISAAGSLSHNTRKLSRVGEEHTWGE